ncbi:Thioredoxin-like protein 4A [Triticum urartu]|uniref:Thioredoxin-like protein 4A n=1 Tax=Triticum urartu TaxID=4572 RepID=M7Z7Z4_TRIUA|nr:Thioredoxin-like protein 4A [Triticum urartu]
MSYLLPHLHSGWAVDQAILAEEERLVMIRFGHDWDETCMQMDEVLSGVAETIKNFAVIYLVDITEVPDFNTMYELYDPSTVMFFFRNKHIMIDLGTGNNNKINWAMKDKQEFVDIVETVYRGARNNKKIKWAMKDKQEFVDIVETVYGGAHLHARSSSSLAAPHRAFSIPPSGVHREKGQQASGTPPLVILYGRGAIRFLGSALA